MLAAAPAGQVLYCLRCRQSSVHWALAGQSTSSHGKQLSLPKAKGDSIRPIAVSFLLLQLSPWHLALCHLSQCTSTVIASLKAGHTHCLGVLVLCLLSSWLHRWLISTKGCRPSGDVAEPSPEFFEFTPDDYHKVMAGQCNLPFCYLHMLHVRGVCLPSWGNEASPKAQGSVQGC